MPNPTYDTFISYASEDESFATSLATELTRSGFFVWFAPLNLKVGDRLLDSINVGLNLSRTGLLILSPRYIQKKWTSYELDVLHRQHIETDKRLIPLWHGVTKSELDAWNPGLAAVVGLKTEGGLEVILTPIMRRLSEDAPFRGVAPVWEDPFHRFLSGQGELNANTASGATFNLFELMLAADDHFPVFMGGRKYEKSQLAYRLATVLAHKSWHPNMRPSSDALEQLAQVCKSFGFDPEKFA